MPRIDRLTREVREVLEQVSGEDIDEGALSTAFVEVGFDSLLLTQVAQKLSQKYGVPLKLRQLLEDLASVTALATHLDGALPREAEPAVAAAAPPPAAAPLSAAPVLDAVPAGAPKAAPTLLAGPLSELAAGQLASASSGPMRDVILQQLAVMSRQLELIAHARSAGLPRATSAPSAVAASPGPGLPAAAVPVVSETVATAAVDPRTAASSGNGAAKPSPGASTPEGDELLAATTKKKGFGPQLHIEKSSGDSFTPQQDRHFKKLVARYTDRTKSSKAFTQRNRARLSDPRSAAGFKPRLKELVYPIVVGRSKGCRLWDLDGNEYVDLLNGYGSNFLGYSPDFVKDAMKAQLDLGIEIGPQHPLVEDVTALVCELTGSDRVAFCNTGSEAVLASLRIARTVTGRNTIAMFNGSYHGLFDEVVVRGTKKLHSLPAASGIPPEAVQNVLVLEYGDPKSLEILAARAGELAAILVEPVQSRRPELVPVDFCRELRRITEASGTALIFDEVVTGFRCAPGGAQERFGLKADLGTYGKVIGGGLSIGLVAGKRAYMDALDGGYWQFGDDSIPEVGVTYFAGTFVRHPLALAATRAVLAFLKKEGPGLQRSIDAKAERFAATLNAWFAANHVPLQVSQWSSVLKIAFTEDVPWGELLFLHLREKGVHVFDHRPSFMTLAHTDADVDFLVEQVKKSVAELWDGGFLQRAAVVDRRDVPPVPGARLGRDPSGNPAWYVPDPKNPGKYRRVEAAS